MGKLAAVQSAVAQPSERLVASAMPSAFSKLHSLDANAQKALLYCTLLAIQFGLQPMIAAKFTPPGISKSSIVIATELTKIAIAIVAVLGGPASELANIKAYWTLQDSVKIAALPATLYAIQNLLIQYGYVYLDSMSFNLLNQTKVSLEGQTQSRNSPGLLLPRIQRPPCHASYLLLLPFHEMHCADSLGRLLAVPLDGASAVRHPDDGAGHASRGGCLAEPSRWSDREDSPC